MKLIVFAILVGCSAQAEVSDRDTLLLMNAKNADELNSTTQNSLKIQTSRAECEAQNRAQQVPVSCFETLKLELELGMIDKVQTEVISAGLSASCEERAFKQSSIEILDAALKKSALPLRCRQAVEKRRREILYIMSAGSGTVRYLN